MTEKRILTLWNDEGVNDNDTSVLRKKSRVLPAVLDKKAREDIQALIDSFMELDGALGLAAPQIGISKRIIVFLTKGFDEGRKVKRRNDFEVLINPRITQTDGDKVTEFEGCLSCPELQVGISRSPIIKVRALNEKGEKISKRYLNYVARVVQHELDHLDGKLIVDYEGAIYYPKKKQEFYEKLFKG